MEHLAVAADRPLNCALSRRTTFRGYTSGVLPSERPTGPLRRVLHYFGLANATDERLRHPASAPRDVRVTSSEDAPPAVDETSTRERVARAAQTAAVYFGLADDPDPPGRSRYGRDVAAELDAEIDALRARVAELETQVKALCGRAAH